MNKNNFHKNLSHLSKEKTNELIYRYYQNENVISLLEEFHINTPPSSLFKLFPPVLHQNYPCPNCGNLLSSPAQSKSRSLCVEISDLFCANCGHVNNKFKKCECDYCTNARKQAKEDSEKQRKAKEAERRSIREIIEKTYAVNNSTPYNFDELSFTHKVYLSAICKALLVENYSSTKHLHPIELFDQANPITPSDKYTQIILYKLCQNSILRPSPNSDLSAFAQEDENGDFSFPENFPYRVYSAKACFVINVTHKEGFDALIKKILLGDYYNSEENAEEALNLWKIIAKQECISYLEYQLSLIHFDTHFGKKTNIMFEKLLENFSVSQIYAFIWKEVASASKAYLEHRCSKTYAKNIAIHGVERYGNRAIENRWDIMKYTRDKNLPQSILSEVFFNLVLSIKDDGFNKAPSISLL